MTTTYYVAAGCGFQHMSSEDDWLDEENYETYNKEDRPFPIRFFDNKDVYETYIEAFDCYYEGNVVAHSPNNLVIVHVSPTDPHFLSGPYETINDVEAYLTSIFNVDGQHMMIKNEEDIQDSDRYNYGIYWRTIEQMNGYKIYSYHTADVFYGCDRVYVRDEIIKQPIQYKQCFGERTVNEMGCEMAERRC